MTESEQFVNSDQFKAWKKLTTAMAEKSLTKSFKH